MAEKQKKFGLNSAKEFFKIIMAAVAAAIATAVAEVKAAFGSALEYKGSVATYDALPTSGQVKGDTYNVEAAFDISGKKYPEGTNVAWDGEKWDPLGGVVDLSNLATKAEVTEGLGKKLDTETYEEEKEDFLTADDFEEYTEAELKEALGELIED